MDTFLAQYLPLIIGGLVVGTIVPAAAMLLRPLRDTLAAVKADTEKGTAVRVAAAAGEEALRQANQIIDSAANETTGLLARFQRPESLGGIDVTAEEWAQILATLGGRLREGFGQSWTSRALQLGGALSLPKPTQAEAEAMIESAYLARADIAEGRVARPFGEAPLKITPAPLR